MRGLAILLALLLATPAYAHKSSDSYLTLRLDGTRLEGRWDIALRDLDAAIGLDDDGDGRLTWDELRARHDAIARYALARLQLDTPGGRCTLVAGPQRLDQHTDGVYTVLPLAGLCPATVRLTVNYRLFADVDAQHRGLLRIGAGADTVSAILGGEQPVQTVALEEANQGGQFLAYVRHGVDHIWHGYDHLLFLISLLLPAVLVWRDGRWHQAAGFGAAAVDVARTVTAFTLAHSLTLALAALGMLTPPSRWVEAAIAASVVIAALNNVWPLVQGRRWVAALLFGLVHGFGFAGVLGGLGLPSDALAVSLLGFNAGVELGQLAVVAVVLPIAFAARATFVYRRVLLPGASLVIAVVACAWLGARVFDWPLAGA